MKELSKSDIYNFYNNKQLYKELCDEHSYIRRMYLEETKWKVKHLSKFIMKSEEIYSVLDIGCATGDFLSMFPYGIRKKGIDICEGNIQFAKEKYPQIDFICSDFYELNKTNIGYYDIIIISEILEHIMNDEELLKFAVNHAKIVLINIPLENQLKKTPEYGLYKHNDGHLRGYSQKDICKLIRDIDSTIVNENIIELNKSYIFIKQRLQKLIKCKNLMELYNVIRSLYNNNIPKSYILRIEKNSSRKEKCNG